MTYSLLVLIAVSNCYVGTQRDACRYEVKFQNQEICNPDLFSIYLIPPREGFSEIKNNTFIGHVIICIKYFEKLKNCDDDNNRFKPGLYGNNQLYPSSEFYLGNNLLSIYRRYSKYNIIKQS